MKTISLIMPFRERVGLLQQMLEAMYSKDSHERIFVPLDNWKDTPNVWQRRFA